jgi:hypothetical protein
MKNLRNSMEIRKIAALLSFYILLFASSLAQVEINVNDLLSGLVSLAFIIIFIIILLAVGGVIKRPTGGAPWFLIFFIALIILLFVLPQLIQYPQYFDETSLPDNFREWPLPSYASQVFIMLGLPKGWMYVPAIIYLFILPFTAIYTLVWAFLQSLGIFASVPSTVNRVLAFIIAFLTIPFGWFVKLVWVLFSFMGAWSVVIFAATFIVGIFCKGATTVYREKAEFERYAKTTERAYKSLIGKLESIKKLPSEDQRRVELDKLMTQYGTELHLAGEAYSKVVTAKEKPTDENINAVIQEIKNKVKI